MFVSQEQILHLVEIHVRAHTACARPCAGQADEQARVHEAHRGRAASCRRIEEGPQRREDGGAGRAHQENRADAALARLLELVLLVAGLEKPSMCCSSQLVKEMDLARRIFFSFDWFSRYVTRGQITSCNYVCMCKMRAFMPSVSCVLQ